MVLVNQKRSSTLKYSGNYKVLYIHTYCVCVCVSIFKKCSLMIKKGFPVIYFFKKKFDLKRNLKHKTSIIKYVKFRKIATR